MENFDIWLLHLIFMKITNHKTQTMKNDCNNNPLSTEGNKSPLQLCQASILKHQVVDGMIDPETLHFLSEWQGIDPLLEGLDPMIAELTQDANAENDQMDHINQFFSVE